LTEKKVPLEELLTKAISQSPDVQLAEAKVREAEATLRQARVQVAQKLVEAHTALDQHQQLLMATAKNYNDLVRAKDAGAASAQEAAAGEAKLLSIKAQVAQLESQINALTGKFPAGVTFAVQANPFGGNANLFVPGGHGGGGIAGASPLEPVTRMPRATMAARMRKALDAPVKKFEKPIEQITVKELIALLRDCSPEVPIMANLQGRGDEKISIDFRGPITLGGLFQGISDTIPGMLVFVRDYGFLITFDPDQPLDAMRVSDFHSKQPE
jgi:hypothetical protein